jgi:hypothetical protein
MTLSNLKAKCGRLTRLNCRSDKRNTVRFQFLSSIRGHITGAFPLAGVNKMNEKAAPECTRIETDKEIRLEGTTICPGIGIGRVRALDQKRIYKKAG